MEQSDRLKKLLDSLRDEVGPLPEPQPAEELREAREIRPPHRRPRFVPRVQRMTEDASEERPPAVERRRPRPEWREDEVRDPERNTVWDENKEILLFGMLASLAASLGGLLAGINFLVIVGAAVFVVFSVLTAAALFAVIFFARRRRAESAGMAERVDALSRRVEALSRQAVTSSPAPSSGGVAADPELERKVEELRVMVKGLSKALEGGR